MRIKKTKFDGLYLIEPAVFNDDRGYFYESFNEKKFAKETFLHPKYVQDNISKSSKDVLRGLHYQIYPHAQAKLVSVLQGSIVDFVVDLRLFSKTFGKSYSFELNDKNKHQLFIPKGFAHGFHSLEDDTIVHYKVDEYYNPKAERTLAYESIFAWEIYARDKEFIVSEKDQTGLTLDQCCQELKTLNVQNKQLRIDVDS